MIFWEIRPTKGKGDRRKIGQEKFSDWCWSASVKVNGKKQNWAGDSGQNNFNATPRLVFDEITEYGRLAKFSY